MKKKTTPKQILALGAVVLLAGLYLSCLILTLFHNDMAARMLQLAIVLTVLIPVTAYVLIMFYKLSHHKDETFNDAEGTDCRTEEMKDRADEINDRQTK